MALAHHDAPDSDQRSRREPKLLRAQQRRDGQVPPGPQLPVDLHRRAAAKVVGDQRLVRLCQAELPGQATRLDRRPLGGTSASVVARDQDVVGVALDDTGGDDADAVLGNQFHRHSRGGVGRFQVINQLGQVLDRVDVVVRRRGDEADTGGRPASAGNVARDFPTGKLAALSGLRALRNLDLQLVRVGQIVRSHAEASRGHLLDRGTHLVGRAVGGGNQPARVLAALARVGLAAEAVHRHGQRGVRLERDGAVGHRARDEPWG